MKKTLTLTLLYIAFPTSAYSQAPNMIQIPGGTILMGCTPEQPAAACNTYEKPVHEVTISPFELGKYEVTQAQWSAIVPDYVPADSYCNGPEKPITKISHFDAFTFCNRLSIQHNLKPCYYFDAAFTQVFDSLTGSNTMGFSILHFWDKSADGYRLPTESEWEYAARAGQNSKIYAGSNNPGQVAWYTVNTNTPFGCRDVGTKAANSLGLHDMSGNVWEMCWDWTAFYPASILCNPTGPSSSGFTANKISRGGSYVNASADIRVATRGDDYPSFRSGVIGLRVAKGAIQPNCTQTLTNPPHMATDVQACTFLSWEKSNFAVSGYRINAGTASGKTDLVNAATVTDTFFIFPKTLPLNDTVFVKITPFHSGAIASDCPEFWFVTNAQPAESPISIAAVEAPSVCIFTQLLEIQGDTTLVDRYFWNTGANTPSLEIQNDGTWALFSFWGQCADSSQVKIAKSTKNPAIDQALTIITPTLPGDSTGAIDLTVKGGVAPFVFDWRFHFISDPQISDEEDLDSLVAGDYFVKITDKVGCESGYWWLIVKETTVGIGGSHSSKEQTLRFFPNPGSGIYYVDSSPDMDLNGANFQVFNTLGERLLTGIFDQNQLDLSAFAEGVYFLKIGTTENKFWSGILVKTN